MNEFEVLDDSGDVGLRVKGDSLEELFANAASGLSNLITEISDIPETESREVVLKSSSNEGLLVLWLNEIIFLFDAYGFIGRRFSISLKETGLKAVIYGDFFNPAVHEKRLLVKAATYHNLSLVKNSCWEATILFDI